MKNYEFTSWSNILIIILLITYIIQK